MPTKYGKNGIEWADAGKRLTDFAIDVWPGYFDIFGLWHFLGEKERLGEEYYMCRKHNKGCTWCGMPFEGMSEPKECRCGLTLLWRDPNPSGEFCDDCFDEGPKTENFCLKCLKEKVNEKTRRMEKS